MSGGFCWRCDQPIKPGQPVETYAKVSISAGGRIVTMHTKCPKRPAYVRRTPR
ncbi:hypothetical protein OG453_33615 [Streptomyces sp. NBC_01381]|uniref:hypothetical protein n=1 Tax=Streptomyces sp. NBC_01381 TaxID=2903845 RepID=UPI00225BFF5B|nr:hypothetical protein [Streptomyces sp. NBC_01381]MCX4671571.1 hypothetical protein [Streptomyces sp. NBC_01381]